MPEIVVTGRGVSIPDGNLFYPDLDNHTDFWQSPRGGPGVARTFTVLNTGADALTTSSLAVPTGFILVEGLSAVIPAGQSDTFTIRIDTSTAGVYSASLQGGWVSFVTNDSDENPFNFRIDGLVIDTSYANDVSGSEDDDWFDGGALGDWITGDEGDDRLFGGDGHDSINGGDGDDEVYGGPGDDSVSAGVTGDDLVYGGDGNDDLFGKDQPLGSNQRSRLFGGDGNDEALAGANADLITGGAGTDYLYGGGGNDEISGDGGDDVVFGDNVPLYQFGIPGDDELRGGAGADLLVGGKGRDTLIGGDGKDWLTGDFFYSNIPDQVQYLSYAYRAFFSPEEPETLGAPLGKGSPDIMRGGKDQDAYFVENQADVVDERGGSGIDTVVSTVSYSLDSSRVKGKVEELLLLGAGKINGAGNDLDNHVFGNKANNVLNGKAGDDELKGFEGKDTLTGGGGRDVFVIEGNHSGVGRKADVIVDFDKSGNDRIDLSEILAPGFKLRYIHDRPFNDRDQIRVKDVTGPDVVVQVGGDGPRLLDFEIVLRNSKLSSMGKDDFIL